MYQISQLISFLFLSYSQNYFVFPPLIKQYTTHTYCMFQIALYMWPVAVHSKVASQMLCCDVITSCRTLEYKGASFSVPDSCQVGYPLRLWRCLLSVQSVNLLLKPVGVETPQSGCFFLKCSMVAAYGLKSSCNVLEVAKDRRISYSKGLQDSSKTTPTTNAATSHSSRTLMEYCITVDMHLLNFRHFPSVGNFPALSKCIITFPHISLKIRGQNWFMVCMGIIMTFETSSFATAFMAQCSYVHSQSHSCFRIPNYNVLE